MARIFMSHSSKDKAFVCKLSEDLKALGHEPWLDEWEIKVGECIVSKIIAGIKEADYVILVLTPDSVMSGWVDREWKSVYWSEVQEANVKVLPVLLRKCELPVLLHSKRYADFTSRYETGLSQLLQAISQECAVNTCEVLPQQTDSPVNFRTITPKKITIIFKSLWSGQILEVEVITV